MEKHAWNAQPHGYFDINLNIVWDAIRQSIPVLARKLQRIRQHQMK